MSVGDIEKIILNHFHMSCQELTIVTCHSWFVQVYTCNKSIFNISIHGVWFLRRSIEVIFLWLVRHNPICVKSTNYMWTDVLKLFTWRHVIERFMAILVAIICT